MNKKALYTLIFIFVAEAILSLDRKQIYIEDLKFYARQLHRLGYKKLPIGLHTKLTEVKNYLDEFDDVFILETKIHMVECLLADILIDKVFKIAAKEKKLLNSVLGALADKHYTIDKTLNIKASEGSLHTEKVMQILQGV